MIALLASLLFLQADSVFKDPRSKEILERGRVARMEQDSTLLAYSAFVYERISFGLKIGELGKDRGVYRDERASRVQWHRGMVPFVDVIATRATSASSSFKVQQQLQVPIPYYPGQENFGFGSGFVQADINARDVINPIARGAEQYYTYSTGDSLVFTLPGQKRSLRVSVHELVVRPRRASWNVVIGSLWFDDTSGRLVRAVYRLADPIKITIPKNDPNIKFKWLISAIKPLEMTFNAIVIDYGLHDGKYWLPRTRSLEGEAQASFVKMPFVIEQAFRYASVNGSPPIQDSTILVPGATRESTTLVTSGDLAPSIFNSEQDVFAISDRSSLIKEALTLSAQPLQPSPNFDVTYGFPMTRYNKIEGLSTGLRVERNMGAFTAQASARVATADVTPNAELSIERGNGWLTKRVGLYRRLSFASDWGIPFGFGRSLDALLVGNDEGLYYRSVGSEMSIVSGSGRSVRLFAEHQNEVDVNTRFSLARIFDSEERFDTNIVAQRGNIAGLAMRRNKSFGSDAEKLRIILDSRVEAATGTFDYTRAALDATVSRGLGKGVLAALTASGGTSGGSLPIQRLWYLGGAETVRGEPVGSAFGNSFWMAKGELGVGGKALKGARITTFGDLGWAGSRKEWSDPGRPLAGAGFGLSLFRGLVRMDVARGIYPEKKWRAYSYVEAAL